MNTMKYFNVMERMDQLIRLESTGDSFEFSEKLGVSRRQMYYYIEELKDLGLPLSYNRRARTYFYEKNCRLKIDVSVKEMGASELTNYIGGFFSSKFILCISSAQIQPNFTSTTL
jgi:hypothetical protein